MKSPHSSPQYKSLIIGLICGLFAIVFILEYTTPVEYLFGYLYTVPILLASFRIGRRAAIYATRSEERRVGKEC